MQELLLCDACDRPRRFVTSPTGRYLVCPSCRVRGWLWALVPFRVVKLAAQLRRRRRGIGA